MRSLSADVRRQQRLVLTGGLIAIDIAALAIALIASHRIAAARSIWHAPPTFPPALAIVIPVAIGLFAIGRLYVLDELFEGSAEYGRVVYGCTLASLSLIILGFWGKILGEVATSRTLIVLVWAFSTAAVGAGRFGARRAVRFLRRRGHLVSRAVMVGLGASGIAFAKHFEEMRHAGVKIVGFVDDFLPPGTPVFADLKVLGSPSVLHAILEETGAQEVIIVPTAMAWESFQDLIRRVSSLNGYVVRLAPGSRDLLSTTMRAHQLGFIPMLTIERIRITGLDRVLKSVLDYGIALLLLPAAAPITLFAAALLRASRIPTFRRIRLIGRGGIAFTTFALNTADQRHPVQRCIARFGVDRFPQLISVFLGRMSLVGPRPIPADRRRPYETWLPSLLAVKPGLTGVWAVRPAASVDEEMELSLFYIRNYTIWLDVEVLIRSVLRLMTLRGGVEGTRDPVIHERVPAHR